jgi:hypothetical protein
MTEERKKDLIIFAVLGAVIWIFSRPKTSVRYRQEVGTMTALQLAENFKELISSPLRVYINPSDEGQPDTGTPWAVDLAAYVKNYAAVKEEYKKYYGGDLSTDLIAWFRPAELSEFVAALWKNEQVMS